MHSKASHRLVGLAALAGMVFVSVVAHVIHPLFHDHGSSSRAGHGLHASAGHAGIPCGDARHVRGPKASPRGRHGACPSEAPTPKHVTHACPICTFVAHVKAWRDPLPPCRHVAVRRTLAFLVPPEVVVRFDACLSLLGPRSPPAVV